VLAHQIPMLVKVEVRGMDDVTIMHRLGLNRSEMLTFKAIWLSGDVGTTKFEIKEGRKYVYFLRKKLERFGINIVHLGLGSKRYAFDRDSHRRIAEVLNGNGFGAAEA
jgi:predicted glycosyltransferase involved in capsule biosynthesis